MSACVTAQLDMMNRCAKMGCISFAQVVSLSSASVPTKVSTCARVSSCSYDDKENLTEESSPTKNHFQWQTKHPRIHSSRVNLLPYPSHFPIHDNPSHSSVSLQPSVGRLKRLTRGSRVSRPTRDRHEVQISLRSDEHSLHFITST